MANRYQGGILGVGFNPLRAPDAPTIGTATAPSSTTASVAFTAPANVGGSAITSYAVQSTPGNIGATGSSSPITVSGLTAGTAYTFRVTALNSYGPSPASASSNSVTPPVAGQQAYTTPGTYSWVAPAGVTSISAVAVGGGGAGGYTYSYANGGGGGGLAWVNNRTVVPGNSYTVVVGAGGIFSGTGDGGTSQISGLGINFIAYGGQGGNNGLQANGGGFLATGGGGGQGGGAQMSGSGNPGAGGGGAGGYSGNGGLGAAGGGTGGNGTGGAGGGGAGGYSYYENPIQYSTPGGRGGSVGILGQGASGAGAAASSAGNGGDGSGGGYGSGGMGTGYAFDTCTGGDYVYGPGGGFGGAVRIIWPGTSRSFPSTNTGNL